MIPKSAWQNAYREILEDGRERIGPPPTPEKIEELLAGKLPEEEAERVRESLAYYPELLRVMTEPVPDPSTVVTDEEVAGGLERLRQRIQREPGPPIRRPRRPFPRILMPAAAVVILLAGGILAYRRTHR